MISFYESIVTSEKKLLAILIDPDKFYEENVSHFLSRIPVQTTHIFVGGSTVANNKTEVTVKALKKETNLPVFLFPGNYEQITNTADAILFLSLLSGRNPEYLIGQQVKAVRMLKESTLEVIPTGYILIDGDNESAVARVSQTQPMPQDNIEAIVNTALAGEYLGAKLIYLEAGSGAKIPVNTSIIEAVKKEITLPLIVGGGIRTNERKEAAYIAGADMVVMGTVFEEELLESK
ncbi:geranylgeranylglyceryl/heptaprenylglyceryl phosphate synthase [Patiriisocius hiemis]|uniref:Geranylgeranylglyceryl phosphate synthase n=1 Tax=Patiriisocius hiemis TaxID=3075604 RepID=A0ABU2YE21_9FLAO|nr:geranylgeranylglyceryl/heptaprenylglyceryl phosphate synthase [Constantimarinum sp. W242]MDT0556431.1 geranylgeranylglyceryl/heptaprenylglyceryl phosphate synthase [Constantimarinum sp. W242]